MSANVDAMVREGVNAYKAGRHDEARALLLKATELDQYNEQAWLWLSGLMDGPDDQRTCLENVLAINPNNERAKQGLSYLTGQTSAGNVSPFSAAAPPPAPSPTAPTSVEWGAPQETPSVEPVWSNPRPQEPSPAALDDWVTNLNLAASDAQSDFDTFGGSRPKSPFGDFDPDEEDEFAGGPFSAAPLSLDDDLEAPPARRRAPIAPERTSPEPPPRRRNTPTRTNGSLYDVDAEREAVNAVAGDSEMFGYIPAEIVPTRLPGTNERVPLLLRLAMILLVVLNLGVAVVVAFSILT